VVLNINRGGYTRAGFTGSGSPDLRYYKKSKVPEDRYYSLFILEIRTLSGTTLDNCRIRRTDKSGIRTIWNQDNSGMRTPLESGKIP
jgi:hypothetical protein